MSDDVLLSTNTRYQAPPQRPMAFDKERGWRGWEGGIFRTVMEAAKGPPYRLLWQVLFSGELLSTLAAEPVTVKRAGGGGGA